MNFEALTARVKGYFKDNKTEILEAFFSSLIVGLLAFYVWVINDNGSPDALCEGLYFYVDADWALQCGRWAIRYVNLLLGNNVVMPLFILAIHVLCITASTLILKEEFNIKSHLSIVASAAALTVTPVVITQFTYQYMTLCYTIAFFLTVLFGSLAKKTGRVANIFAIVALAISMGLYQSYIGSAVVIVCFALILSIFDGTKVSDAAKSGLRFLVCGVLGCILNVVIYKFELLFRGLEESSRVNEFSIASIFTSLPTTVKNSYKSTIAYFNDSTMNRRLFYGVFAVIVLIGVIRLLSKLIKEKKTGEAIAVIIIGILIPVEINIIHIFIPYNDIVILMQYQNILLIPFGLAVLERVEFKQTSLVRFIAGVMALISAYTCIVSANATYTSLKVSYSAIQTETEEILADVYDLDGYVLNSTTIMFAGFPSDANVRQYLDVYKYAVGLEDNAAYWEDMLGVTNCRRQYLLNYCGVFSGYLTSDQYYAVINSDEFKEMPIWPAEGSVKMIDGIAVVKLTDQPYNEYE